MNEFKQEEDQTIVGEDRQGLALTHYVIAERLVALDCTYIIEDGAHRDVEYLADKLGDGWRGYHRMSPGELWSEWCEHEENFYEYWNKCLLICGLAEDDPLNNMSPGALDPKDGAEANSGKRQ